MKSNGIYSFEEQNQQMPANPSIQKSYTMGNISLVETHDQPSDLYQNNNFTTNVNPLQKQGITGSALRHNEAQTSRHLVSRQKPSSQLLTSQLLKPPVQSMGYPSKLDADSSINSRQINHLDYQTNNASLQFPNPAGSQYHSSMKRQESGAVRRQVSLLQESQSQVSINVRTKVNVASNKRIECVNKAQDTLTHREYQFKHMKTTLTGFKDGSLSALGKIGYKLTDIAQQKLNLKKDYIAVMKEHQKALFIEQQISHVDDEALAAKNRTLSKVTQDKIAMRKQNGDKLKSSKEDSTVQNERLRSGSKSKIKSGHAAVAQSNEAFQEEMDMFLLAPGDQNTGEIKQASHVLGALHGFESQKSAPQLKIRIQQAKLQNQQIESRVGMHNQEGQKSKGTLLKNKSSMLSGMSYSQSPIKLIQRLNSNDSNLSGNQFISPDKQNKGFVLVQQETDFKRLKPVIVPHAPFFREKTIQNSNRQQHRQVDKGCSPITKQNKDIQKQKISEKSQYFSQQRINTDRRQASDISGSNLEQIATERTHNRNYNERLMLSVVQAKTDLVEKEGSHRTTVQEESIKTLVSPDPLLNVYFMMDDSNNETISEEQPTPLNLNDRNNVETMTGSQEQIKSYLPSPIDITDKPLLKSTNRKLLDKSRYLNNTAEQSSSPQQAVKEVKAVVASNHNVRVLPQTTACMLQMKRDIRDFQQKQKQFRNFLVLKQDPAFTNHENKKIKQQLHNQMRLQSLFGSTATTQKFDENATTQQPQHNQYYPSSTKSRSKRNQKRSRENIHRYNCQNADYKRRHGRYNKKNTSIVPVTTTSVEPTIFINSNELGVRLTNMHKLISKPPLSRQVLSMSPVRGSDGLKIVTIDLSQKDQSSNLTSVMEGDNTDYKMMNPAPDTAVLDNQVRIKTNFSNLDLPTEYQVSDDKIVTVNGPTSSCSMYTKGGQNKSNGFKTNSQRRIITQSRIDTHSGLSLYQTTKKPVNFKNDIIIRPLTGHSVKKQINPRGNEMVAATQQYYQTGNQSKITRNYQSHMNLNPIIKLDNFSDFQATGGIQMIKSYNENLSSEEPQASAIIEPPSKEYPNNNITVQPVLGRDSNVSKNVQLLDIHCGSMEEFINIRHENESTQLLKTSQSSKNFSNKKLGPIQHHQHVIQRPLIQFKPTKKSKTKTLSDRKNIIQSEKPYAQSSTTHTMYNTFKSQKAAMFQVNPYNNRQMHNKQQQHQPDSARNPHINEKVSGVGTLSAAETVDPTSLIIMTNMSETKRIMQRSRQERMQYSRANKCAIHSDSGERDIYLAKTFPPVETSTPENIIEIFGGKPALWNQTAVNFSTEAKDIVNGRQNGEIAVQTEGGSKPPSMINNSPLSKACLMEQDVHVYSQSQLRAGGTVPREDSSATESAEATAGQVEISQGQYQLNKILKNVTDMVPVKFTPIVSSKNSRSSSCIFKGSHVKVDENSKQCIKTSMDTHQAVSKLKHGSNLNLVEELRTLPEFSTQKSASIELHNEYSSRKEQLLHCSSNEASGNEYSISQMDILRDQMMQSRTNVEQLTNKHDLELHGRTMPMKFDPSFSLDSREFVTLRSSKLASQKMELSTQEPNLAAAIAPRKVSITVNNDNKSQPQSKEHSIVVQSQDQGQDQSPQQEHTQVDEKVEVNMVVETEDSNDLQQNGNVIKMSEKRAQTFRGKKYTKTPFEQSIAANMLQYNKPTPGTSSQRKLYHILQDASKDIRNGNKQQPFGVIEKLNSPSTRNNVHHINDSSRAYLNLSSRTFLTKNRQSRSISKPGNTQKQQGFLQIEGYAPKQKTTSDTASITVSGNSSQAVRTPSKIMRSANSTGIGNKNASVTFKTGAGSSVKKSSTISGGLNKILVQGKAV